MEQVHMEWLQEHMELSQENHPMLKQFMKCDPLIRRQHLWGNSLNLNLGPKLSSQIFHRMLLRNDSRNFLSRSFLHNELGGKVNIQGECGALLRLAQHREVVETRRIITDQFSSLFLPPLGSLLCYFFPPAVILFFLFMLKHYFSSYSDSDSWLASTEGNVQLRERTGQEEQAGMERRRRRRRRRGTRAATIQWSSSRPSATASITQQLVIVYNSHEALSIISCWDLN